MHPTAQIDLHVLDTLETQLEQRKRTKQYVIKQQSKSKVKGYSFGISKQSDRGSFTPGPGHYENPQVCPISYTIGGKLKEPANRTIVPPMGEYEIKGLDKYGYYTNSKFKNACATLFSPPKPDMPNKKATPGPGEYFLPGSMNDNGVYFVSGFKTRVGWVMGKKSVSQRKACYHQ